MGGMTFLSTDANLAQAEMIATHLPQVVPPAASSSATKNVGKSESVTKL